MSRHCLDCPTVLTRRNARRCEEHARLRMDARRAASRRRRAARLASVARTCADCPAPLARPHARYCDDCRWRHRGKPAKYIWTPERDTAIREAWLANIPKRSQLLADRWGIPKWAVTHRAIALGITRPDPRRQNWTAEEEAFLFAAAGSRHARYIARKLGRTLASVTVKMKRMQLRSRVAEGYTMRELEQCFGVDHRVIGRWIREGKLEADTRGYQSDRDALAVTDAALLRFVLEHPMSFELRRVHQTWFMDLITSGGVIKRALAQLAAEDAA